MNLNNVTLPLGLKKCFYIAPKAIFSRYLQCFLHITHPKGCMQHSTKNSKIKLPCRKNAFFLRERIPANMRKKQFSYNLQRFFAHFQHRFWSPKSFPFLSLYCWVDVHFILGLCWCILGLYWCQSCSCWCSCCASGFGSRCLRGCCELVDVVGASLLGLSWGMLRRLGVYVGASWDYLLRLCWRLLAYVGPSWDYVGRSWVLCWAILALSWGHLGTMLGFVGLSWAYVGPAWDYVGRSWVLCWAILALSWGHLGTMLGFVGSSWAYVGPA